MTKPQTEQEWNAHAINVYSRRLNRAIETLRNNDPVKAEEINSLLDSILRADSDLGYFTSMTELRKAHTAAVDATEARLRAHFKKAQA